MVLPQFPPIFIGVDKEVLLVWLHVMGMLQTIGDVFATLLCCGTTAVLSENFNSRIFWVPV